MCTAHLLDEFLYTLDNMLVKFYSLDSTLCDLGHFGPRHWWLALVERRQLKWKMLK